MQINFPRLDGRCRRCPLNNKGPRHKVGKPCHPCQTPKSEEHATLLLIAALIGAATRVADTMLDLGRTTGWWH